MTIKNMQNIARPNIAPKARIVITAFNSDKDLTGCVSALAAQTRSDFEVIIVNNDPSDKNFHKHLWPDKRFTTLHSDINSGFSGGSNLGAKHASTEWIITLNPDTRPALDWFETLMKAAETHPQYSMLSSTLIDANNEDYLDGVGDAYSIYGIAWRSQQGKPKQDLNINNYEITSPCGAAAAYRRKAFEDVGGYDDSFFCYLEDVDLGLRMQLSGHKCLHIIDAKLNHYGAGSTGKGIDNYGSETALYYTYKNQLRLMLKNVPMPLLLITLPTHVLAVTWVLFRMRKHPHHGLCVKGRRAGWHVFFTHLKSRKQVQSQRSISVYRFAKLLIWSPLALKRKS